MRRDRRKPVQDLRCRQHGTGWQRLKQERHLHPRLAVGIDHDALDLATPQLRAFSLQRVLSRLQPGEPIHSIFC
jgi:hypothetical protein